MKLTNEQKIKVLKEAKRLIKNGIRHLMCTAIEQATENLGYIKGYRTCRMALKTIPELKKYKPQYFDNDPNEYKVLLYEMWFNSELKAPRIKIFNKLIKELGGKP